MEKEITESQENLFKKLQEDMKREAVSEFNRYRLNLLANQIKSKNYGRSLSKASGV